MVAAQGLAYEVVGGIVGVGTGYAVDIVGIYFPSASEAGALVEQDLELPADARIQAAQFSVVARPAGADEPALLRSVATVRPATALSGERVACSIDFGRLVTVGGLTTSGLMFGLGIDASYRWTGSTWSFLANGPAFAEVSTERILVESTDSGDSAEDLAERLETAGAAVLPAVPGALELQVDGTTVWFERQGSSAIDLALPEVDVGSAFVVDRTDAVRNAFALATVVDGRKRVRIGLRAAAPGRLTLTPNIAALRVHTHPFPPDGLVRTFELGEEGEIAVDVTPPGAADVREVAMVVRGSFGPDRVQPAIGPALVGEAHLALAPARPVLFGLPTELTERFGKLNGVRLTLRAPEGTGGGELTGRLLADADGRPGEPVAGGDLTAVTVGPGPERWYTLPFVEPVDPPEGTAWLELQPAWGEVECALTTAPPTDPDAPGATVLRRLPGGGTTGLSVIPAFGPLHAAVRLVGRPERDRPIPAVELGVAGAGDSIGVNPTGDDLPAALTLAAPLPVTGPVELTAVAAAPGSLTLDTVQVTYREEASP